ncbi:MAG: hypothetical protein OXE44_20055 [Nitrospinae bacterium]|nr:hypothetical protein [Nitrospinota bacterium]
MSNPSSFFSINIDIGHLVVLITGLGVWGAQRIFGKPNILRKLDSYHANTIVMAVKRDGKLADAELLDVSNKANEFFGKSANAKELYRVKASQLLPLLKDWMDKDKFEAFAEDQDRLFKEYEAGKEMHAKVPVIFNDKHPHYQYRNRAFLPVIVSLSGERVKAKHGEKKQDLQIVYLDLEPIVPVVEKYTSPA